MCTLALMYDNATKALFFNKEGGAVYPSLLVDTVALCMEEADLWVVFFSFQQKECRSTSTQPSGSNGKKV